MADLSEFRYARSIMPLERKDRAFVYLSDPWFRLLVSPRYRFEMTRRMQAEAEIELAEMAALAAASEGLPADSIASLIEGGFLPRGFESRPDGSKPVFVSGEFRDSLRGARRTFLPIPDVEFSQITRSESEAYYNFARSYERLWKNVDPAIIGIQTESPDPGAPNRQRVVMDVHVTPYAKWHYGGLSRELYPPLAQELSLPKSYLVFLQGRVKTLPAEFQFLIILDKELPLDLPFAIITDCMTYAAVKPRKDPAGNESSESDKQQKLDWNWNFHGTKVGSATAPKIHEELEREIDLVPAKRPAQLRLNIADLEASNAGPGLRAYLYNEARRNTAGNLLFLDTLDQQLLVRGNKGLAAMKRILGAEASCALNGKYQYVHSEQGPGHWESTAGVADSTDRTVQPPPEDYRDPLLEWFHGLSLEFSIDENSISTHMELDIESDADRDAP